MIYFLSNTVIVFFIFIILFFGIIEKKNVLELFLEGIKEGEKTVVQLFPILLALIVAIGMLTQSGFVYFISNCIEPILKIFKIEKALSPLILMRPISGSTTTAIATQIMKEYGVDSKTGLIASCIMGSTETTIYVTTIYSSKVKVKEIKEVLMIGLIADFIGILMSCFAFDIGLLRVS